MGKKYEDYKKELEQVKDPIEQLKIQILLDIRYVLNSIDKQLKGKTQEKKS